MSAPHTEPLKYLILPSEGRYLLPLPAKVSETSG